MKKLILSLLFLMSFFALKAQEIKESEATQSEITFSLENKSENAVPKIIINRESIFDCWDGAYKLSDGTKLSNKEFNALLKADANKIFVKKQKYMKDFFIFLTLECLLPLL